jgi:S1-C subfamily serine protease
VIFVVTVVTPIALILATVLFFSRNEQPSTESTPSITSIVVQTSAPVSVIDTRPPTEPRADQPNWELLARSVVFIEALSPCDWRGSGTIVLDGSFVLTNEHVASSGDCPLRIGLTTSLSSVPTGSYEAVVLVADAEIDLAVLRLVDDFGNPLKVPGHDAVEIDYGQPPLGSQLATLGYPALGSYDAGMTITFTSGTFSGIDYSNGEFFKTDAQMRGGVSGGAAFNERGLLVGIPTAGLIEEDTNEPVGINLIRPVRFEKSLLEEAKATSTQLQ